METLILIGQIICAILFIVLYKRHNDRQWFIRDNDPSNTIKRNEEYRIKKWRQVK